MDGSIDNGRLCPRIACECHETGKKSYWLTLQTFRFAILVIHHMMGHGIRWRVFNAGLQVRPLGIAWRMRWTSFVNFNFWRKLKCDKPLPAWVAVIAVTVPSDNLNDVTVPRPGPRLAFNVVAYYRLQFTVSRIQGTPWDYLEITICEVRLNCPRETWEYWVLSCHWQLSLPIRLPAAWSEPECPKSSFCASYVHHLTFRAFYHPSTSHLPHSALGQNRKKYEKLIHLSRLS